MSRFTASRWRSKAGLPTIAGLVVLGVLLQAAHLLSALVATALLLLPGYLLTWSMLQPRFGMAAALAVGGAASIALASIGGLVLNLLPWGLEPATWLGYVVVLSAIGLVLRGRRRGRPRVTGILMSHEIALFGLAGIVVLVALVSAQLSASSATESFTQLWLRPAPGESSHTVEIDIRSEEGASTNYRLELRHRGVPVQAWEVIRLEPGERWTDRVDVGRDGRARALLFRLSDPGVVYRETTLTLPSTSTPSAPPAPDS